MKIDALKFKNIQIAILRKQLVEVQLTQSNQLIKLLLIDAGLEPNKKYNMNEDELTIDETE